MARIPEVDPESTPPRVRAILEAQRQTFGAPLNNHLLYAHDESLFRGARGMWAALDQAVFRDAALSALVNRRVAARVGCVF
ncbi:hypothetical protein Poly30_29690 [Planctomycetes bacterium Poly30]|uniref:Uncharacterized protein n=1 Tax=Saltatorellus ferox TaxID=2528018 RepID=A0A518ETM3_9BACT|nr:hypothetical protein Poly30_29690 [Planctomycetes bacterium Poly30]